MQETASVKMLFFGGAKGCSFEKFCFRRRGRGRSAPLHSLGRRGARGLRPSRAFPGLGWREFGFPTMQEAASVEMLVFGGAKGCSDEDFVSDGASVGRSAPLHPSGDGVREGCDPLALSRGWFGGNLDFRRCRKVLRWRCRFSAAQRAVRMRFHFRRCRKRLRWRCWLLTARRAVRMRISFPAARAWGAPLPYTPSGDGVREGCDPLTLSRGWAGGNFGF